MNKYIAAASFYEANRSMVEALVWQRAAQEDGVTAILDLEGAGAAEGKNPSGEDGVRTADFRPFTAEQLQRRVDRLYHDLDKKPANQVLLICQDWDVNQVWQLVCERFSCVPQYQAAVRVPRRLLRIRLLAGMMGLYQRSGMVRGVFRILHYSKTVLRILRLGLDWLLHRAV